MGRRVQRENVAVPEDPKVRWQSLWRFTAVPQIPTRDLQALRHALDLAASGDPDAARLEVEHLGPTVRWVADEDLIAGPPVSAILIELVDLVMVYDATLGGTKKSALYEDISNAILTYARLNRPGERAQNGRCYCGSGKKYKQCHGADSGRKTAEA
jgi:hypothetical protein